MNLLLTEFTEKQLKQTIDSAKKSMGHRNLARIQACERELERRDGNGGCRNISLYNKCEKELRRRDE